jgi:hypothetical protein
MAAEKVLDPDKPMTVTPMGKIKATASRGQVRMLWMKVQSARDLTKTVSRRLAAANAELEDAAKITVRTLGRVKLDEAKVDEVVTLELSVDAALGIKEAVVQAIKGDGQSPRAALRDRIEMLDACKAFGSRYVKEIEKASAPPDGDDDDDEKDEGLFDPPAKDEEKKEG